MRAALAFTLAALALVACSREVDPSAGTIVYVQGTEVRSVRPDGSQETVLAEIDEERRIRDMAVDAQGERIAFVDDSMMQGGDPPQIVIMNADGTGQHVAIDASELPDKTWNVNAITWSPRGDELALCLDRGSVVVAIDGSSSRPVGRYGFCVTDWSEDGSRLLGVDGGGIVETDADGSDRRVLIDGQVGAPVWSPDRSMILYEGGRDPEIRWARSDGTDQHRLEAQRFSHATWSPDGSRIVVVQGFDLSMVTMTLSGEDVHQVLGSPGPDNWWPASMSWQLLA